MVPEGTQPAGGPKMNPVTTKAGLRQDCSRQKFSGCRGTWRWRHSLFPRTGWGSKADAFSLDGAVPGDADRADVTCQLTIDYLTEAKPGNPAGYPR